MRWRILAQRTHAAVFIMEMMPESRENCTQETLSLFKLLFGAFIFNSRHFSGADGTTTLRSAAAFFVVGSCAKYGRKERTAASFFFLVINGTFRAVCAAKVWPRQGEMHIRKREQ
jgi:hypothetical protein